MPTNSALASEAGQGAEGESSIRQNTTTVPIRQSPPLTHQRQTVEAVAASAAVNNMYEEEGGDERDKLTNNNDKVNNNNSTSLRVTATARFPSRSALRYGSPQPAVSVKWREPIPEPIEPSSESPSTTPRRSRTSPARNSGGTVVNNKRRSAPRYRLVPTTAGSQSSNGANQQQHASHQQPQKTVAETRLEFAERVANKGGLHLASGYGTTFTLPSVPKAQLSAMLGGAGAVRYKGTNEFTTDAPLSSQHQPSNKAGGYDAVPSNNNQPQQMARNARSAPRPSRHNQKSATAASNLHDESFGSRPHQHHHHQQDPHKSKQRDLSCPPSSRRSLPFGYSSTTPASAAVVGTGSAAALREPREKDEESIPADSIITVGGGDPAATLKNKSRAGRADMAGTVAIPIADDGGEEVGDARSRSSKERSRKDTPESSSSCSSSSQSSPGKTTIAKQTDSSALTIVDSKGSMSDEEEDEDEYEVISYLEAGKHLAPFAGYATLYLSLTMIMTVLPLGFVGNQLGEETLAGASVGYFMLCMFAVYPTMGMMYALDTLCSHEYGRDNESDYLGLLLQRGLIVGLAFLFTVCGVFYGFLGDILLGFYSDTTKANAQAYLRYAVLFLVPLASYSAFAKFNSNQQRPHVPLVATAVGVGSMIILLPIFVSYGLEAVMLCTAASAWVQLFVIIAQSYLSPVTRKTLGAIRLREALEWSETRAYLRIAIPAAIFVAAETAAFDLSILLATAVSEAAGSAWSALLSYELVFVCVGGGFSAAACAKVGAAIGANQPINAKTYAWTALTMSMVIAIFINAPFIYFCFDFLITTFGGNLAEAKRLQLLFPFLYIIDTIQFTFQGIFGGASLNDLGAQLLLSCLWGVGVPIAVFLSMGWWDTLVNWFGGVNVSYPFWSTIFMSKEDLTGDRAADPTAHFYWGTFAWIGSLIRSLDGLVGVATGIFIGISILGPTMIFCLARVDWDKLSLEAQMDDEEVQDKDHSAVTTEDEDEESEGEHSGEEEDEEDLESGEEGEEMKERNRSPAVISVA